jgi:hypothetical protein
MSTKEQLKEIHAAKCQIFQKKLTDAKQTGTLKTTGEALVSIKQFSSLAGQNKAQTFEKELFVRLEPYNCGKSDVKALFNQHEFLKLEDCLEQYKLIGLTLIDDMFE